jgi:amino acid adenylation domain-containing protein
MPKDCIHTLVERQAARTPHAVAVVYGSDRLTYGELNGKANALAHQLSGMGVGPETLVGVCLERSLELVVGLLAVLKAGGAYVPLDPGYPPERLGFTLRDAAVRLVLTRPHLSAGLPATTRMVTVDVAALEQCDTPPRSAVQPDNLAYVIYTSGSTGVPKGAMNSHRGVTNRLLWMQATCPLDATDAVLQKTPFSFDVSVGELFWPLLAGARLIVARPGGHQDPAYLVRTVVQERITTLAFVPSLLAAFLEEPDVELCNVSLRQVMCSGEALTSALQERFDARLRADLHNLYGPTEAAIEVSHWRCRRGRTHGIGVPIGRPIANIQLHVLDAHGVYVERGDIGELYIGGIGVCRGYHARAALTAERFVPDPFHAQPGARMYRTGDMVRLRHDGALDFLGRADGQVKIRGFRIELGEIETRLVRHPAVRQAAVVAWDGRLVAYVVPRGADRVDLKAYLAESLPEYMLPSTFVRLSALPLTSSGKLDRRALPAPGVERPDVELPFVTPRSATEALLAELFADALGLERVGIDDDFFDLGGHSLSATRVTARLRTLLQVELSVSVLFEAPTVARLALALADRETFSGQLESIARAWARVRAMSADEIQAALVDRKEPAWRLS